MIMNSTSVSKAYVDMRALAEAKMRASYMLQTTSTKGDVNIKKGRDRAGGNIKMDATKAKSPPSFDEQNTSFE